MAERYSQCLFCPWKLMKWVCLMWIDQEWILTCSSLTYSILILSILNLNIRVFPLSICSALCHWKYTWLQCPPHKWVHFFFLHFISPPTWLKSGSGLGPAPSYHLPLNANLAWNTFGISISDVAMGSEEPRSADGELFFVSYLFSSLSEHLQACAQ